MDKAVNSAAQEQSAVMVVFGGTGDLTHRKLIPALYNLVHEKQLPAHFAVVSVGRRDKTTEQYRGEVFESLQQFSRNEIRQENWEDLNERIFYFRSDFDDPEGYARLGDFLIQLDAEYQTRGNRIFYLAVAPEYFDVIVAGIERGGLVRRGKAWHRLALEKPYGRDLETARALNRNIGRVFPENSIYRIDHYLGKEMIQNIMVLRFTNSVFSSLWSNRYIDNVQISLLESGGVGSRGGYYENAGAMRDMFQNHIMQILSLIAMEPPVGLDNGSIKDEKLKVIRSIAPFSSKALEENVVFGQYGSGKAGLRTLPGYREEERISAGSETETFAALKLCINNFRWAGIPFYIRTGKRMAKDAAYIVIQFKPLPDVLYFKDGAPQEPNLLTIRIQPNVGVCFQFNTKDFNMGSDIMPLRMDTSCVTPFMGNTPEAYERLLGDIMRGDTTLFSGWEEVEASWDIANKIIDNVQRKKADFPNYPAGSMGPAQSDELLARDGRKWWDEE